MARFESLNRLGGSPRVPAPGTILRGGWLALEVLSACTPRPLERGASDAGRLADTPLDSAPEAHCRWRAEPAIALSELPSRHRILDVAASDEHVWIALDSASVDGTRSVTLHALRLGERPMRLTAIAQRTATEPQAALGASLVAEPGRFMALLEDSSAVEPCSLVEGRDIRPSVIRGIDPRRDASNSALATCGALAQTSADETFLSGPSRPAPATVLLTLTAGREVGRVTDLTMNQDAPIGTSARSALSDRSFVWLHTTPGVPGPVHPMVTLRARRFTERGEPLGPTMTLAELTGEPLGPAVVELPSARIAVWGGAIDTYPPVNAIMLRPLDPTDNASPIVDRSDLGLLSGPPHAVAREDELLLTARVANGGTKLLFIPLRADTLASGEALELVTPPLGAGLAASRVVPTPQGALVLTTAGVNAMGGTVLAIPIRCMR
jgi:hypothetical protein